MTIADKLLELNGVKQDIKTAIEGKGVDMTGVDFGGYAGKIDLLPLPKEEQTKTVSSPNFSSGNVVVTPDSGKVLTQVTVVKDNDLVPENIVKDVDIFGVVGTAETVVELTQAQYDALPQGETWLLNETLNETSIEIDVSFTAGVLLPVEYMFIARLYRTSPPPFDRLTYQETTTEDYVFYYSNGSWINEDYRTITFETSPTGDLLTWLEENAVKQTDGVDYDDNTYYLIVEE